MVIAPPPYGIEVVDREPMIQRTAIALGLQQTELPSAPPIVHEALCSPGQPLDRSTRTLMEPRFGSDFSSVRVHTDIRATESARAVNALAYTVGREVVFGARQFAPGTGAGQRLLAHELAHVVQQNGRELPAKFTIGLPNDKYEQEADRVAQAVAQPTPGGVYQRQQAQVQNKAPAAQVQRQERGRAGQAAPTPYERPAANRFHFCFIMGTSGAAYSLADSYARAYYSSTHQIIHASSLCGLLEAIQNRVDTPLSGEERNKIGQVVIISHAAADGTIFFPINERDTNRWLQPADIAQILSHDWLERTNLICRIASRAVAAHSDNQTQIMVKGCNLGQNQAAVDALRHLFGGQATVTAPKKKVELRNLGYGPTVAGRRTPAEVISWLVRNGYLPPEANQWPPDRKNEYVRALFSAHAGMAGIPADLLILGGRVKVLPSDPRYRDNLATSRP